jgi:guanylate kinase
MRDARSEISHWAEFDYLVVNEDFDTALKDLQAIVRCVRVGRECQQNQHALLLAELLGSG